MPLHSNYDTKATLLSSTRVGTRRSPTNHSNEVTFAYQRVVARHRQRGGERKEKGKVYADCQRNARESEILEGDKVLLRQEKEKNLSTPHKQSPFIVIQKNGNGVLVEADGVRYRQNVTRVKKYFERDYDVLPATSKSTDNSEAQRATQSLSNQEPREPVNVSSEGASEDGPLEYTRSDDATTEQRNSVTLRPARVKRLPS